MAFREFGGQHLAALAILALLSFLVAWAGMRLQAPRTSVLGRALFVALVGYVLVIYLQKGLSHDLHWDNDLPLELCHWMLAASAICLLRPSQLAFELAYFWGLAGGIQALVTPDINSGFPSWEFVFFFWSHGAVLLAIVFMMTCQGLKPQTAGILRVFAATNVYGAIVGGLDAIFGWNYGYLCRKPAHPSLIDYLGPWPWYLLSLEGIALMYFVVLYSPWWLFTGGERRASHGQW